MQLARVNSTGTLCLCRRATAGRGSTRRLFTRRLHQSASLCEGETNDVPTARPPTAPKPRINVRHIRENAELHRQNCLDRNYARAADVPERILALHAQWRALLLQQGPGELRRRSAALQQRLVKGEDDESLLAEARDVKARLGAVVDELRAREDEIKELAAGLPNLTLDEATPRGTEPAVVDYINEQPDELTAEGTDWSHVDIGTELGLIDFAGAATTSGWGWYYLIDDGARLEQALVAYALERATAAGWRVVSPPSMVYGHMAWACGFQPRDMHGETQTYAVARGADDTRPERVLTATAEIPLAAMRAQTLIEDPLPARLVAASRCYRAEAGARGADTKGLYRVHEFTKVELFAWTRPDPDAAREAWEEVLRLQEAILGALGLRCRVLEMPTGDLGASAARKRDVEAWFPSRRGGWGEVASASICTDYQTRRLDTRLRVSAGKLGYPWTVNGTALAVPRVLAALLEEGWDEATRTVRIPEVLRPWMEGKMRLEGKKKTGVKVIARYDGKQGVSGKGS